MNDSIFDVINKKAKSFGEANAYKVEEIIKKIIVENDCKPSDVIIEVDAQSSYRFLLKKDEYKVNFNETITFNDDVVSNDCDHQWDFDIYLSYPSKMKCKKCGVLR